MQWDDQQNRIGEDCGLRSIDGVHNALEHREIHDERNAHHGMAQLKDGVANRSEPNYPQPSKSNRDGWPVENQPEAPAALKGYHWYHIRKVVRERLKTGVDMNQKLNRFSDHGRFNRCGTVFVTLGFANRNATRQIRVGVIWLSKGCRRCVEPHLFARIELDELERFRYRTTSCHQLGRGAEEEQQRSKAAKNSP